MVFMDKVIKILLFEDNIGDADLIEDMINEFSDFSYEILIVETLEDGLDLLKKQAFDVILLDLGLPDSDGIDTFLDVQEERPEIPIIILTGLNHGKIGINAVKKGAQDYLIKGQVSTEILKRSIRYSIERKKSAEKIKRFTDTLEEQVKQRTEELSIANELLQKEVGEHERTEEKLKSIVEELRRSNRELEQFAYVASHDLQEPLRMVSSFTQLLGRRYKGKLDDDADEFINFAVDGAQRMQQLITDLLAYSRVTSQGKDFEPVKMEDVLEESLLNLKLSILENEVDITHDPLPEVVADPSQIGQIFQNLIGNAIKFRSEKTPEIHISVEEKDNQWLFQVDDNGIGIDPVHSERIFLVFQRLHERGVYPGTGIGLSICQKIVERHGGDIWVDSQLGKGSTFCFTISKRI